MKKILIACSLLVLVFVLVFSGAPGKFINATESIFSTPSSQEVKEKRILAPRCFIGGGEFYYFSNTCADTCGTNSACGLAFTYSCDCGPGKCWNGLYCATDLEEEKFNEFDSFCQELGLHASQYGNCDIFSLELGCSCGEGQCWNSRQQKCVEQKF